MISYKDQAFCASEVEEHTCGREFTKEDEIQADKVGLGVAYGKFCEANE